MKYRKQHLSLGLIIAIHSIAFGQKSSFLNNPHISDSLGNPNPNNPNYFQYQVFKNTTSIHFFMILVDSSYLKYKSEFMQSINEPILNNYYLGRDIIRLTWTRAFDPEIIVRLEKTKNGTLLYQKKLERIKPIYIDKKSYRWPRPSERKIKYKVNSMTKIDNSKWNGLTGIMDSLNFDNILPNSRSGMDGSVLIIERVTKEGWKVVARFSPFDDEEYKDIKFIADYIIANSEFKKEKRY